MRIRLAAWLTALMAFTLGAQLQAANLVTNGNFELLTMTSGNALHSTIIGTGSNGLPTSTGWRSSEQGGLGPGYNFIMVDNPTYNAGSPASQTGADDFFDGAYTSGAAGGGSRFSLYGPDYLTGTRPDNTLTNSPVGGNFLAADGSYFNRPVEQTITGLSVGTTYYLSFYWAAAQQGGLPGNTKEAWVVCIGTCSYTTHPTQAENLAYFDADFGDMDPTETDTNIYGNYNPALLYNATTNPTGPDMLFRTNIVNNPEGGFTPWQFETFSFTATSSTATLSLLAYGTPLGQPPFSLIDGIVIDTVVPSAVPEPTTWAMMLIGFGVVGGLMRTRRRSTNGRGALASQIV